MSGPRTRCCPGPALVLLAMLGPGPSAGLGQENRAGTSDRATIEQSAPINNLIKRARQGSERRDWKFTIDSLQRIIDQPQAVLLERSPGLYESARRFAVRELSDLPPEGLAAYRILYDSHPLRRSSPSRAGAGRGRPRRCRPAADRGSLPVDRLRGQCRPRARPFCTG